MPTPIPASDCPFDRYNSIFERAVASEPDVPNAATLATATPDGKPSARVVLVKSVNSSGFAFFTNYESHKARELDANPHAALCFHFKTLAEQVRVRGRVERASGAESDEYFASRPRGSQIAACASEQSSAIESREQLETRVSELEQQHDGEPIPRPSAWGGYRLVPEQIEFWVNRDNRLHDRWLYQRTDDGGWLVTRLAP